MNALKVIKKSGNVISTYECKSLRLVKRTQIQLRQATDCLVI